MATLTVELPLNNQDRELLLSLLGPSAEPPATEDPQGFKALADEAYQLAKSILDDKSREDRKEVVKAALEAVNVKKVTDITTVPQAQQFIAALSNG